MFQLAYQPRQAHPRRQRRELAKSQWDHRHVFVQGDAKQDFRFLHVSTDEVYGSLTKDEPAFTETHRYASKAASDHLVRAYRRAYGMPVLTTNCSNNYGPYHFPEKPIPLLKDTVQR